MLDVLIRGARVVDGSGAPSRVADVAVKNGKIATVGKAAGRAARTLDAEGLCLMPGIVDLHTHYDAQITWDVTLSPSVSLGVTTAVLGNCGFGIAPCAPGMWADLLLFDPSRVGISALRRRNDLPGGRARMTRDPLGVHGVWVNGLQAFDGTKYSSLPDGPGRVLRTFDP